MKFLRFLLLGLIATGAWFAWIYRPVFPSDYSDADLKILESLWIGSLPGLPADPTNAVADNEEAIAFGKRLFFDTRLSANSQVSCASCHQPELTFTDGLPKGRGIGESGRNTRSIIGVAYSPWLYWDGRRDSLWSQALSPLEDPNEHGGNRMALARFVLSEPTYRSMYESIFGEAPDLGDSERFPASASPLATAELRMAWNNMQADDQRVVNRVFSNIGKAIAAFERTVLPSVTRFDAYVKAVVAGDESRQQVIFNKDEILGLQLFIGKARCTECHNGPLLSNHEFHNTGILNFPGDLPDRGRIEGVRKVMSDPFNCMGEFSDAADSDCPELAFARTGPELIAAVRTPSLRTVTETAPYMHKGQIVSLAEVLDHYNRAPDALIGHNEAKPLSLSAPERSRLEAFLLTLEPVADE